MMVSSVIKVLFKPPFEQHFNDTWCHHKHLMLNGGTLDAGVTLDNIIFHISSYLSQN